MDLLEPLDLIELPPIKGNKPVVLNALQEAVSPYVSTMQMFWWIIWISVLIGVIVWFVFLPNFGFLVRKTYDH
jgi:hypothetical protein